MKIIKFILLIFLSNTINAQSKISEEGIEAYKSLADIEDNNAILLQKQLTNIYYTETVPNSLQSKTLIAVIPVLKSGIALSEYKSSFYKYMAEIMDAKYKNKDLFQEFYISRAKKSLELRSLIMEETETFIELSIDFDNKYSKNHPLFTDTRLKLKDELLILKKN